MKRLAAFVAEEDGVTAIEYALLASLIVLVVLPAIVALGTKVMEMYEYVWDNVGPAIANALAG